MTEAKRRGYELHPIEKSHNHRAGVAVAIHGHAYPFEITELTDRFPMTDAEVERWRRDNRYRLSYEPDLEPPSKAVPNGRLKLSLPYYAHAGRVNWNEGPRGSLESKLASVFSELERRAEEDERRGEERRLREEERRRQEEARLEQARLQRIEDRRVERLREELARWRLARDARDYAGALSGRLGKLDPESRERISRWCEWIEAWADRADPTLNVAGVVGIDDERDMLDLPIDLWPARRR